MHYSPPCNSHQKILTRSISRTADVRPEGRLAGCKVLRIGMGLGAMENTRRIL